MARGGARAVLLRAAGPTPPRPPAPPSASARRSQGLLGPPQCCPPLVELPLRLSGGLLGGRPRRGGFLETLLGLGLGRLQCRRGFLLGGGPLLQVLLRLAPGVGQRLLGLPALGHLFQGGDVPEYLAAVGEHRRRAQTQPALRPRPGHHAELVGEGLLADNGAEPVADEAVAVLRLDVTRPALAERLVGGCSRTPPGPPDC